MLGGLTVFSSCYISYGVCATNYESWLAVCTVIIIVSRRTFLTHPAITCLSFSLQQLVKDIFGIQPPELPELQPQLKHVSLTRQFAIQLGNSIISPIRIVQYEHFVVSED